MGRHTTPEYEPTPAIVRDVSQADWPTEINRVLEHDSEKIISQPKNTVTHSRGWGPSGYKVQVVNHDCPKCGFERMVRRIDVSPEFNDEVRYWCLNPNCVHFVRDHLSHACHGNYPQYDTTEPEIFEA